VRIDYLIDGTSADEAARLLETEAVVVSAVSVFELLAGVTASVHVQQRAELIKLVEVAPVTETIALRAGELYTTLRRGGVTIDNEDILIAATAVTLGIPLFTINARHFEKVPGLSLHSVPGEAPAAETSG
jgi:predicted nucleic acid-binding protein